MIVELLRPRRTFVLHFPPFIRPSFSAEPTDAGAQESLLDNIESSLLAVQSESCEGLSSIEECFKVLSGMAKRKAPGLDGLPAEFYLKFCHVLGQDLLHVLNSCYTAGCLTLSQHRGVISLSFKKGAVWICGTSVPYPS